MTSGLSLHTCIRFVLHGMYHLFFPPLTCSKAALQSNTSLAMSFN